MRTPFWPGLAGALIAAGCASRAPAPDAAARSTGSVELVVAATTDVHGRLRGWDYYADSAEPGNGLTRAATIVDSLRAAHPGRVILLDAGDLLQGNPLTHVAARVDTVGVGTHPVVAAMNAMRYDASAIGNHEFNYGVPLLDRAVGQASFPFLSANTRRADGGRKYRAWTVVERAGVRVGIVGATTPGVMLWDRDNVRAAGVELRDIVPEVRTAVGEVRAAGAQVVVVTVHSGLGEPSSYDTVTTGIPSENVSARLAREVPGIDLVVYGHSHKEMADTVIGSTLLVQAKNWAASVAVAHLGLERAPDGGWRVASRRGQIVRVAGHAESPAVLAATERAHRATVAYVTTPIGSTPVAWRGDSARVQDTPLIDFILEVQRRAAGADLASTAAFSLDSRLDAGPITIARLQRLYPYENTLRAVRITGRQLREYLEHSSRYYREPGPGVQPFAVDPQVPGYNFDIVAGADYALDVARPVGSRVRSLSVKGRPVADTDSFTLALNNYRQTGGGGFSMLAGAPVVYDRSENIRDLLIEEVRRRGTIRPEDYFARNWILIASPGGREPSDVTLRDGETMLRVIATNDFHGALEPRPDSRGTLRGGAAAVAAAVERAAGECKPTCETILLDGGDMFQGTPASNLAFGRPVVELFNAMGYAAAALGNHEWDWGRDTLRARMRQARYRILGANVRYEDGRDVEWIPDDTLVTRGRIRVGVIGLTTLSTPRSTRISNVAGLRFDEPAPIVDARARALRARGADVVLVTDHAGALFCEPNDDRPCSGEIIDLANAVTERVDAIVSGHTHSYVDTVVRGIPVVQARSRGTAIDVVDLAVRPGGGGARVLRQQVRDVLTDSLPANAAAAAIVRRAVAAVAPRVSRRVGEVVEAMPRPYLGSQTSLGNFVADAQRWAGKGDIAVMNNGGLRADLRAGPATYGALFEVQPFANILYRVTVRGDALRQYLERLVASERPNVHVSGVTISYDPSAPRGSRVVDARLDGGREIRGDSTYSVVMNDFMVTGGDNLGLGADAITTTNLSIVDLDALIDYARSLGGTIRGHPEPRIRAANRP